MKNFSILKKLGAAAVSAAMLASVGTVGFAADMAADNPADGKIAINNIAVTKRADGANKIYDVAVSYTTTVPDTADITMLAYVGKKGGSEFTEVKQESIQNYADATMEIVGVEQENNGELDGTMTFSVTDNANANINVNNNLIAIVKLGGEGVDAPAAAIVNLDDRKIATKIITDFGDITVKRSAITNDADAAKKAVEAKLTDGKVAVADAAGNKIADVAATVTAPTPGYDSSNTAEQTLVYTVTVDSASTDDYVIKSPIVETVNVTVPAQVQVASAKLNSVTGNIVFEGGAGKTETDVKTRIKNQTVNLYSSAEQTAENLIGTYPLTNIDDASIVAVDNTAFDSTATQDYDITYEVTLPEGVILDGDAAIPAGIKAEIVVKVTFKSFTVDPAKTKLLKDGVDVTNTAVIEIEAADAENAIAKVKEALKAYNARVYPADNDPNASEFSNGVKWNTDWDTDTSVKNEAGDYTVTGTLSKGQSVGNLPEGTTELTVSVSVKVKSTGVEYILGDVNGNGRIQTNDWMAILNYLNGTYSENLPEKIEDTSKWSIHYAAADVNSNGRIQTNDWMAILNYINGNRDTAVGTTKLFSK